MNLEICFKIVVKISFLLYNQRHVNCNKYDSRQQLEMPKLVFITSFSSVPHSFNHLCMTSSVRVYEIIVVVNCEMVIFCFFQTSSQKKQRYSLQLFFFLIKFQLSDRERLQENILLFLALGLKIPTVEEKYDQHFSFSS